MNVNEHIHPIHQPNPLTCANLVSWFEYGRPLKIWKAHCEFLLVILLYIYGRVKFLVDCTKHVHFKCKMPMTHNLWLRSKFSCSPLLRHSNAVIFLVLKDGWKRHKSSEEDGDRCGRSREENGEECCQHAGDLYRVSCRDQVRYFALFSFIMWLVWMRLALFLMSFHSSAFCIHHYCI